MSGESPCVEIDEAELGAFMNPKRGSVHWIDTDGAGLDPVDPTVVVNPTPEKDMPRWEASEAASQLCQYAAEGDLSKIRKTVDGRPELLDMRGPSGLTAIYVAAERNQCDAIDLLLELQASVNERQEPDQGGEV
eukprot:CAMPEP_0119497224 /NCGR_PEP_ID=MMETSP1344-20130328/20330_1 /TAXON_ID=236787 /ORGANISM="Florenciella parvula, Strain CCMP2471" /LENGTH=133 /DNA_ID=CAMNT_0007532999 /DNA_START=257 /DNA_END=655 /DNA_ORIENTATION=-